MTNLLAFLIALPLTWNSLTTDSEIPSESSLRGIAVSGTGAICVAGGKPNGGGPEVWVSTDNGKSWQSRAPDVDGVTDYRSVAMPSPNVIVLASAGTPAVIMRSSDLGKSWTKVLHDKRPEAFIDSVRFWDDQRGIAMGDPVAGSFWLRQTDDGGETWRKLNMSIEPLPGEAGFAASNGSVCLFKNASIAIGLGGRTDSGPARLLRSDDAGKSWSVTEIAAIPANASSGIFSVQIREDGTGVAAGGDYKQTERASGHIAITVDHGATWRLPTGNPPRGFRSSVIYVEAAELTPDSGEQGYWLTTGPSGSETSVDGENWEPVAGAGFHAVTQSTGQVPFASGSDGRVAELR